MCELTACCSKKELWGCRSPNLFSQELDLRFYVSRVVQFPGCLGGLCTRTGQQRVPNPKRERSQPRELSGIPRIPGWKLRSSPSAAAGARRAAGSLSPGAAAVSALPAPLRTSFFVDQFRLLPAQLFSLRCAIGTQCYLGNLKPSFVIRMLQGTTQ